MEWKKCSLDYKIFKEQFGTVYERFLAMVLQGSCITVKTPFSDLSGTFIFRNVEASENGVFVPGVEMRTKPDSLKD